MKRVKLVLTLDVGVYENDEQPSSNPKDWEEYFYQSGSFLEDFDVVEVLIDEE